ncbi:MAG: hypothetical protein ACM3SR_01245 [Ignavibacteriales bacterium]
MKLNNKDKSEKLLSQFQKGQNLLTLQRLNHIFNYPEWDVTNAGVILKFHDPRREQTLRKDKLDLQISDPSVIEMSSDDIGKRGFRDTLLWIVVENIAVCYSYRVEDNINEPYVRYFLFKEAPFYIQALASPAIKLSKKSVVTISDDLPLSITMTVNWHGKNQREGILASIADFLNADELIEIIGGDKNISLTQAFDNTLKRMGAKTQSEVSYCLTCGSAIESGKKFCDSRTHSYLNKNQCLIQFNYWLKGRLGIKTTRDRRNKRNEFHKEMLELIKEFPLSAWEEFKRRNPKLYEKRYKERWERERRPKR